MISNFEGKYYEIKSERVVGNLVRVMLKSCDHNVEQSRFRVGKTRHTQPSLDQDQLLHSAQYKHSLSTQVWSRVCEGRAPESVIWAANSQSHETWKASVWMTSCESQCNGLYAAFLALDKPAQSFPVNCKKKKTVL